MSNHYLNILELSPGASKKDIKTAYRRLSKRYHPDLNKSEDAHEKFVTLTEAYNFLMKVGPHPHQESVSYNYDPKESEYEKWRREAKRKARERARQEAQLQQKYIINILSVFRYIGLSMLFFNILLMIDYALPKKTESQDIIEVRAIFERTKNRRVHRYDELITKDHSIRINAGLIQHYAPKNAIIQYSSMFNKTFLFELDVDNQSLTVSPEYGVYHVFGFLILLIPLVIALYFYVFKTLDTKLTLAILLMFLEAYQLHLFINVG